MTTEMEARVCPSSDEMFIPKTKDHFFSNEECFEAYIEEIDPIDELPDEKRTPNWGPLKRSCRECGDEFYAQYPGEFYCGEHRRVVSGEKVRETDGATVETPEVKMEQTVVVPTEEKTKTGFTPKEKICESCERRFLATTPAMKYCEDCSPKGGELLEA